MECYSESKVENFMLKALGGDRPLMAKWLLIRVTHNLPALIMDTPLCSKKGGK